MENDSLREVFLNGETYADTDSFSNEHGGGSQKEGHDFNIVRSHDLSSIYPDMRPLTREDFESEEDWIAYSMNQWFGHLFIDPHLD